MLTAHRKTKSNWIKNYQEFEASLFLNPNWINSVIHDSIEPVYLDFIDSNGVVTGKLSGVWEKNRTIGKNQLFFYSGFALNPKTSVTSKNLLKALYKYASENKIDRIIISSYDYPPRLAQMKHHYFHSTQRLEYKIILSNHSEKNIHHQIKRHLKKASKIETTFKENTDSKIIPHLIELLNNVKDERLKKSRSDYNPFYLKHFTQETIEKLINNGLARIYTIQSDQGINAIEVALEYKNQAYMLLKATDNYGYKMGISSLLNIKVIEEYKKRGFACYNLGGRPKEKDGDGLAVYKTRLGATPILTFGATTNFIQFPERALNPLLNIGRALPENKITSFLKEII